MRSLTGAILLSLVCCGTCQFAHASHTWPAFVHTIIEQPDGRILVAGEFTQAAGVERISIARLMGDGSLDHSFHAPDDVGTIIAVALQSDGRIIIGGWASTGGVLARLSPDGARDLTFDPIVLPNGTVNALAVQPDGRILAGGNFTEIGGTPAGRMVRLNSDGTRDTGFDTGTGADMAVAAVCVQPDGKILVGGSFTDFNGDPCFGNIRLNSDGSLDTGFATGSYANRYVVQPDGKILVWRWHDCFRLEADGSVDASFDQGTGFLGSVLCGALQADGRVVVGGSFSEFDGVTRRSIARLHNDGSLDVNFEPVISARHAGFNVFAATIQADGRILIAGYFESVNSAQHFGIARLNADGTLDTTFDAGAGLTTPAIHFGKGYGPVGHKCALHGGNWSTSWSVAWLVAVAMLFRRRRRRIAGGSQ